MSGFSAEWLALRAAADRRARSPALLRAACRHLHRQTPAAARLRIVELGAGTGSMLPVLAPRLPSPQCWTLVDEDPALLAAAQVPAGHAGKVVLRRVRADLAESGVLPGLLRKVGLVTASALLDLVSPQWCRQLVRAAARPGMVLHAALSYDGRIILDPADPLDRTVRALFNRHQRTDKGFGPALGPAAAATLARIAATAGAAVQTAGSDWRLGPADCALLRPLLDGWAQAAAEIAPHLADAIAGWRARRSAQIDAGRLRVRVGHRDVLAHWAAAC